MSKFSSILCLTLLSLCGCDSVVDSSFRPGSCTPLDLRPVSWWDMDTLGSNFVKDISGQNQASFSGASNVSPGKVGSAWNFSSTSTPLSVSDSSSLRFSQGLTAMAWVNSNRDSRSEASQVVIEKWSRLSTFDTFSAYNANNTGGTSNVKNFYGSVFDGRYVYFAPGPDGAGGATGKVLRYDTRSGFSTGSSWEVQDAGNELGDVTKPTKGYIGAIFDGRYVYFVPYFDGSNLHGRVLRYDTIASFTDGASWTAYDASSTNGDTRGFVGGVFDGRYLYFSPFGIDGDARGRVLRYDTHGAFDVSGSWTSYEASNLAGIGRTRGFQGTVFDGRYVYFVPYLSGSDGISCNGRVLRYDTKGEFGSDSSWSVYDTSPFVGFAGAVFDGKYIYFAPYQLTRNDSSAHGYVVRYDTSIPFKDDSSWSVYNASAQATSFRGALFDGRYVYFIPGWGITYTRDTVLRYDTRGSFSERSSWLAVNSGTVGGMTTGAFMGGSFDGRFLYFVPSLGGPVLRYDTTGAEATFSLKHSTTGNGGGFGGSLPGTQFLLNTGQSALSLASYSNLSPGWHLLAATYEDTIAKLYIDGEPVGTGTLSGPALDSSVPVSLGGNKDGGERMDGQLDEAQLFNRALDVDAIRGIFRTGQKGICK